MTATSPEMTSTETTSRVALFGSLTPTGQALLQQGQEQGLEWNVYHTNPLPMAAASVRTFVGKSKDIEAIYECVRGTDAVYVAYEAHALGEGLHHSLKILIQAMRRARVCRLMVVGSAMLLPHETGALLGQVQPRKEWESTFGEYRNTLGALHRSGLDWLMVCPLSIEPALISGPYKTSYESFPSGGGSATSADIAHYLLRVQERMDLVQCRVGIARFEYQGWGKQFL